MVASSCYLGDMLSAADGCELSITTGVKTAWKKFKELLPVLSSHLLSVLSSHHLSFKTLGHVYSYCVQSAMLQANETWPLTKPNLQHLQQNDGNEQTSAMSSPKTLSPPDPMSYLLGIEDLDLILKSGSAGTCETLQ